MARTKAKKQYKGPERDNAFESIDVLLENHSPKPNSIVNLKALRRSINWDLIRIELGSSIRRYLRFDWKGDLQTQLPNTKCISILHPMERCMRKIYLPLKRFQSQCSGAFEDLAYLLVVSVLYRLLTIEESHNLRFWSNLNIDRCGIALNVQSASNIDGQLSMAKILVITDVYKDALKIINTSAEILVQFIDTEKNSCDDNEEEGEQIIDISSNDFLMKMENTVDSINEFFAGQGEGDSASIIEKLVYFDVDKTNEIISLLRSFSPKRSKRLDVVAASFFENLQTKKARSKVSNFVYKEKDGSIYSLAVMLELMGDAVQFFLALVLWCAHYKMRIIWTI